MGRQLISLPFLVMAAWSCTLVWLSYEHQYQLFLAPKFSFLVYTGLFLSLIYTVRIYAARFRTGKDQTIKGIILFLPVLFIISTGDNTLGNFALSKRSMAPLVTESSPGKTSDPAVSEPLPDPLPERLPNELPLISISELLKDWESYKGKRISVEGLFTKSVSDQDDKLSAVYRYLVNCCAADAMPVGVITRLETDIDLKDEDWVRISGKVYVDKLDAYDVIYMALEHIEKKEKPSKSAPYIYQ